MSLSKKEVTENLQRLLSKMGYQPGSIDGVWGPKTEGAWTAAMQDSFEPQGVTSAEGSEGSASVGSLDENTLQLIRELEREEGCVLHAYKDHLGFWTIGIGRLIDERRGGGITRAEADYLKRNDVIRVYQELDQKLPWWRRLSPVRQRALANMAFQMGLTRLLKFTTSLGHIENGRWGEAANSLSRTLWAQQTPARAARVIHMLEHGKVKEEG